MSAKQHKDNKIFQDVKYEIKNQSFQNISKSNVSSDVASSDFSFTKVLMSPRTFNFLKQKDFYFTEPELDDTIN